MLGAQEGTKPPGRFRTAGSPAAGQAAPDGDSVLDRPSVERALAVESPRRLPDPTKRVVFGPRRLEGQGREPPRLGLAQSHAGLLMAVKEAPEILAGTMRVLL
jgi:hypothetical protein